jgi:protein-disulfide isomerase
MFSLSKQAGFTQESFRACLTNQSLLDGVNAVKDRGSNAFKVSATPTFFVNGAKVKDFNSPEAIDKALTPLL